MPEPIPFLDLVAPHRELESELLAVVQQAFRTASFIGGSMVEGFEHDFAQFCETRYCVGVNSGTDALRFALIAAGVGPGDAVLTVPNTFIATTEAISQAGAAPEFVDIDERTYNLSPDRLQEYLEAGCTLDPRGMPISRRTGKRVSAILPVHLYGQMADMDAILELAERYHLIVIEDACQAHGAEYFSKRQNRWCKAGSMGHAAAFSFYPGKNLGACGEGGAVTTNSEGLAKLARVLRDHGQAQKYYHEREGYNGRLDAIQAGILQVKLQHLAGWNEHRRECAHHYDQLLGGSTTVLAPYQPANVKSVYHLYVVRVADRDDVRRDLDAARIGTGIHYPIPLHMQKAYQGMHAEGAFPVTEAVAKTILSIPMYPQMTAEQVNAVAKALLSRVATRGQVAGI